jgi:hypothetical protein
MPSLAGALVDPGAAQAHHPYSGISTDDVDMKPPKDLDADDQEMADLFGEDDQPEDTKPQE